METTIIVGCKEIHKKEMIEGRSQRKKFAAAVRIAKFLDNDKLKASNEFFFAYIFFLHTQNLEIKLTTIDPRFRSAKYLHAQTHRNPHEVLGFNS